MKKNFLLCVGVLLAQSVWAGEWHALVLGANRYSAPLFDTLDGAVNDAELLAAALKAQGVQPTVLLNEKITYDAVKGWWDQTTAAVQPGDTVFFSFAGHGAREKEHFPGSELANLQEELAGEEAQSLSNALDEVFVLPAYDNSGKHSRERLVDNELLGWFKAATDKGAKVIAVADACFGGGMTRSALSGRSYGDEMAKIRNSSGNILQPEDTSLRGTAASARLRVNDGVAFSNRLFYAVPFDDEERLVPELVIDGHTHGALSYLMAKVLAGSAVDNTGKPVASAKPIGEYLFTASLALSNNSQQALLAGVNRQNRDVVLLPGSRQPEPTISVAAQSNGTAVFAQNCTNVPPSDASLRWAAEARQADFRWACDEQVVIQSGVGPVAYDVRSVADLRSFLHQQQILAAVRALKLPRFAGAVFPIGQTDLTTTPVTVFEKDDQVAIYFAAPVGFDTLFALNLPAKDGLQMVHATAMDELDTLAQNTRHADFNTLLGQTNITPPFGSDHLLLIAMQRTTAERMPFFSNLLHHHKLPSVTDTNEAMLLALQDLSPEQAAIAIVPFSTVRQQ